MYVICVYIYIYIYIYIYAGSRLQEVRPLLVLLPGIVSIVIVIVIVISIMTIIIIIIIIIISSSSMIIIVSIVIVITIIITIIIAITDLYEEFTRLLGTRLARITLNCMQNSLNDIEHYLLLNNLSCVRVMFR